MVPPRQESDTPLSQWTTLTDDFLLPCIQVQNMFQFIRTYVFAYLHAQQPRPVNNLLPPAYVVRREGTVFTGVCLSTGGGRGGPGTPPGGYLTGYPPSGGGYLTWPDRVPPRGGTQTPPGGTRTPPGGYLTWPDRVPPQGGYLTWPDWVPPRGGYPDPPGGYPDPPGGTWTPPGGYLTWPGTHPPPRGGYPVRTT